MEKKQNFDLNYLNKKYQDLHTNVLSDNANVEEAEELKKYKSELIERHKARSAMLRSTYKWTEEGEKPHHISCDLKRIIILTKHITTGN